VLVSFQETRAVIAAMSIMCKAGVIPQSLQLQVQVMLSSLKGYHISGECADLWAARSVCCCYQNVGGVSIGLLT